MNTRAPRFLGTLALGAVLAVLALSGQALASGIYVGGTGGYDISSPQCGGAYPLAPYSFGIVGVTSGRPFQHNSCLNSEFIWAQAATTPASLFMNLNRPIATEAYHGNTGPAGTCAKTDTSCQAYNYGYNAAQDAFGYAVSQGSSSGMWWLDIETSNSWYSKTNYNERVIQGAVDYLRQQGVTVGAYSTKSWWNTIAGAWTPSLSGQSAFPDWVGGTGGSTYCSSGYSFAAGQPVWLGQYSSNGFDADYACP